MGYNFKEEDFCGAWADPRLSGSEKGVLMVEVDSARFSDGQDLASSGYLNCSGFLLLNMSTGSIILFHISTLDFVNIDNVGKTSYDKFLSEPGPKVGLLIEGSRARTRSRVLERFEQDDVIMMPKINVPTGVHSSWGLVFDYKSRDLLIQRHHPSTVKTFKPFEEISTEIKQRIADIEAGNKGLSIS